MPLTAAAMLVASQFTANATDFGKVYGIPGGMTVQMQQMHPSFIANREV